MRVRCPRGCPAVRSAAGFTLIELIVAIGISVVLITILGYVFNVATAAVRSANARVLVTERLRAMNIRLRAEVGGMLPVLHTPLTRQGQPWTWDLGTRAVGSDTAQFLMFTSATVENNQLVNEDVAYVFIPNSEQPELGRLVRLRDANGSTSGQAGTLGDDSWITRRSQPRQGATLQSILADPTLIFDADVLLTNVRTVLFEIQDPPIAMNGLDDNGNGAVDDDNEALGQLNPRQLPAAIRMTVTFGPDTGRNDLIETTIMYFPVARGQ